MTGCVGQCRTCFTSSKHANKQVQNTYRDSVGIFFTDRSLKIKLSLLTNSLTAVNCVRKLSMIGGYGQGEN